MRNTRTGKILCDRSECQRLATYSYLSRDDESEHMTRLYICSVCVRSTSSTVV